MKKYFTEDAKKCRNFSNSVKNLKIPEFEEVHFFVEKTSNSILKVIFKYSKYPSFISINNVTNRLTFQFSCVGIDDAFKEIKIKLTQCTKLPRVMKSS